MCAVVLAWNDWKEAGSRGDPPFMIHLDINAEPLR